VNSKRLAALAVAATAAFAAASGAAGAQSNSTATQVVIDGYAAHYYAPSKRAPDAFDLYGRILSTKKACALGRGLDVYRDDPGTDTKLGHATSDSNSGWSFLIPLADFDVSTDYYATAPKLKLPHHKSCHADTSVPFTPGP
jgi:opacity protein-like surface antigen